MLKAVRAIYEDGKIKLLDDIGVKKAKLYIVIEAELNEDDSLEYTKPEAGCFEVITPDKERIKMSNWTDEEWEKFSLNNFMNTGDDQNVDWEEFFSAENR